MSDSTTPEPVFKPASGRQCALLAAAFAISFSFDRLMFSGHITEPFTPLALFCLIGVAVIALLFAPRVRRQPLWWCTGAAIVGCCAWLLANAFNLPYHNYEADLVYAILTGVIVLPALAMAFIQLSSGAIEARLPSRLVIGWFRGFTIDMVNRWGCLSATVASLVRRIAGDRNRSTVRTVGLALVACVPVLAVLILLLMQADSVFSYLVTAAIGEFDITTFAVHCMLVLVPFPFLFSMLCNVDERDHDRRFPSIDAARERRPMNPLAVAVVLGATLVLYLLFCAVQFTFLFSGHRLPGGYTYAEYARSGFFQLLLIAAINIAAFGVTLTYAPHTKVLLGMRIGLVAVTGVMLASSALRLYLYVDAYGLTWLRLASMLFIVYLAIVLVLCVVRLFTDQLPLMAVCFVLLMSWWLILGYLDPSSVITQYNAAHVCGGAGLCMA